MHGFRVSASADRSFKKHESKVAIKTGFQNFSKKLLTTKNDRCILHVVKAMASLRNNLKGAFFILNPLGIPVPSGNPY